MNNETFSWSYCKENDILPANCKVKTQTAPSTAPKSVFSQASLFCFEVITESQHDAFLLLS